MKQIRIGLKGDVHKNMKQAIKKRNKTSFHTVTQQEYINEAVNKLNKEG